MTIELLSSYSYGADKYEAFPGTEDWQQVAALHNTEGGYDWSDFNAFYSPSARRYFWHGDSGCSCNSWEDKISTAADFENGDVASLLRAWKSFAEENTYNITTSDYLSGVATIHTFKESK